MSDKNSSRLNAQIIGVLRHVGAGALVVAVLLANAFLLPEPDANPLVALSQAPAKLMPWLEDGQLMYKLTLALFGRMTPNFAPIGVVFLVIFWFLVGVLGSVACARLRMRKGVLGQSASIDN